MKNLTPYSGLVANVIGKYSESGYHVIVWESVNLMIQMSNRLRVTGGTCTFFRSDRRMVIELSVKIFATIDNEARQRIIAHELAHAACWVLGYENEHHGSRWQRIAKLMGDTADRMHSHEVVFNSVKRHVYAGTNGKMYVLSARRVRSIESMLQTKYAYVGDIVLDRNTSTYRWQLLVIKDLREIPLLSGYKLAS